MPTPVPINISPSTSVILVSVSDYSTLNQTPVVQLSTVGTIGRLVTIRDNDGLASLDYPIIISTTRGVLFQEQTADYDFSSLKITQPFGSATITLRDSTDQYKWGLVNTFGFPNVQDAVNIGVTNTHLINASTIVITESITNEGTSIFNDQVVIDSSDLITDAIYTSTIDVEVNANMQSLSSINATIDNQSTINLATQDLYADYGEITEGIFSTVYATNDITTDESFIGYRLSTTQATIDDISAITMYADNSEFSSLYTTYEAVFDCEIEANSTIYAEDLQASTLYLIDSRNNLPQLLTVSSGFVKLNAGDIYVIPRLISTRSLYLSSLYLSTIGLTDKTLLTNSQLYTQNNEIFLENFKVLYNTSNYSSVQYITSTLNSSTIVNSNLLTTGSLSTLSNAAVAQTLQTGNFSTLSNASIVQTLTVGNISTNSNIYAANNIIASNTLSSAILNTNQLYASSLAINRPNLQNRYNADISGSLFVPSTFTSSLVTQQLSTNFVVARDFVSTNSLTTSTLVSQGYSAFGTTANTTYRVNVNPMAGASSGAINVNNGFVDNAINRANDGTAAIPAYTFSGTNGIIGMFRPSGSGSLGFATSATERMRVTSGGNIGINTISPAYLLDVNGASRIQSISTISISTNSIVAPTITGSNITLSNVLITSSVNANSISTNFIKTSAISTTNVTASNMFISSLGVNCNAPRFPLDINGSINVSCNANISSLSTFNLFVAGNINMNGIIVTPNVSTNTGVFSNVIIGCNTPSATLTVVGGTAPGVVGIYNTNAITSTTPSLFISSANGTRLELQTNPADGTFNAIVSTNDATILYGRQNAAGTLVPTGLSITSQTTANRGIRMTTDGFIGINKRYPTAELDISGSLIVSCNVNTSSIQTRILSTLIEVASTIGVNCNAPRFALDVNGRLNVNCNATFQNISTNQISSGNALVSSLGINTNNPRYALDIAGAAAISSLLITSNASIQGPLQTSNVSTIGSSYISNNLLVGTSNLFVSSGLVGINTLTPSTTLDVNGTFRTINENRGFVHLSNAQSQLGNGFFEFHDNLAYTQSSFGFVQISRSNTPAIRRHALAFTQGTTGFGTTANVVGAGFLAGSQTFGLVRGVSSTTTSHNGIFMDSASRVGINRNNPDTSFNLDISGSTRINAIGLGLQLNGSNNSTFIDILPTGDVASNARIGFVNSNFSIANNYGTDIVLCNNSAETARFTNNNRLGINCNAPQFRVDIGGNLRTTEYISTPNFYTSNVYFLDSSGNNNSLNSRPGGLYYNNTLIAGTGGGGGGGGIASIPLNLSTNNILVSTISSQQIFTSTVNIASTLTANGLAIFNNRPSLRRWVAGGAGGSNIEYSDDGISWNFPSNNIFTSDVNATIYDGIKYIAGGPIIATSSNGIAWTAISSPPSFTTCFALATNGSVYIAGCSGTNTLLRSTDGSTWSTVTNSTLTFSTACFSVATNGRIWTAVGQGTNTIAYSVNNGSSWTGVGTSIFSSIGYALAWNGYMWVAGGTGTNSLAYSFDGINWIAVPGSTSIFTATRGIAWNGIQWVAVGSGTNSIAYSYDGITWVGIGTSIFSTAGRSVAWNGILWIAGGEGTNTHAYSYDGINWTGGGSGRVGTRLLAIAYSSNLQPDIQMNNFNIYGQNIPNYITSTNQLFVTSTSMVLNNSLYVNNANDRVGINNSFPSTTLDVTGSLRVTQNGFVSSLATNSISTTSIVAPSLQVLTISSIQTFATSSFQTSSLVTTVANSVRASTLALNASSIALGVTNAVTPLHIAAGTQYSSIHVSYDANNGNSLLSVDGLRMGLNRSANGSNQISLIGDTANPTFGLQLMRSNADSYITHAGTSGNLQINASNAAAIQLLTTNSERMRITATGSVGIGTTTPTQTLDVRGSIYTNGKYIVEKAASAAAPDYTFNGDSGTGLYSPTGTVVALTTNGAERLRINGSGNVGIGLTNPSFRLDVSGGSLRVASNALLSSVQTNFISTSFMNMSTLNANYVSAPTIMASNVSTTSVFASSFFGTYGQISTISTTTLRGQTVNTNSLNATLLSTTQLNTSSISATTVYANIITGTIISAPTVLTTTLSLNNFTVQNMSTTGVATMVNSSNATNVYVVGGQTQGGSNASIVYSSDGITWTNSTNGYTIFNNTVYSIIYDGNNFLAAGQGTGGNAFAYSADGNTWTGLGTLGGLMTIGNDLAYNGRRYIALGQGTNTIAYNDSNGISGTWTGLGSSIFSSSGNVVLWTGLRFVAVGTGTTNSIAYSDTGASWTGVSGSKTLFSGQGNSLAYNGVLLIAMGEGTNTMATSRDGITWTALSTSPFTTAGYDVTWNGEIWVAVGAGTNTLAYSTDGRTWTGVSGIFTTAGRNVIWNGIQFIATGQGTNTYATSRNGINWTGRGTSWLSAGYASAYSSNVGPDVVLSNFNIYSRANPIYNTSTNTIFASQNAIILNDTLSVNRSTNSVQVYGSFNADTIPNINGATINASSITLNNVLRASTLSANTLSTNSISTLFFGASNISIRDVARILAISTTTLSTNVVNAAHYNGSSINITTNVATPSLSSINISTNLVSLGQGTRLAPSINFGAYSNTGIYSAFSNTINFVTGGANNPTSQIQLFDRMIISSIDKGVMFPINRIRFPEGANSKRKIVLHGRDDPAIAETDDSVTAIGRDSDGYMNFQADNSSGGFKFANFRQDGAGSIEVMRVVAAGSSTENVGRVGIGTASPQATLHVVGNSIMTNLSNITSFTSSINASSITLSNRIAVGYGSESAPTYTFSTNTNTGFYCPSTNILAFATNGVECMRITDDGRIGIGISTFSDGFFVNKSMYVNDSVDINGRLQMYSNIYLINGSATEPSIGTFGGAGLFFTGPFLSRNMAFTTNSSERMRITSAGFVGIGTTTPTTTLHVTSGANQGIMASNSAGDARMFIQPATGGNYTELKRMDGTNGEFILNNNGTGSIILNPGNTTSYTSSLTITSAGNVGVGVTDPSERLDVDGGVRLRGGPITTGGSTSNAYIYFAGNGATTDWAYLRQIGGTNQITLAYDFNDDIADVRFVLRNNPSATGGAPWEVLRVDNDNTGTGGNGTMQVTQFSNATPIQVPALSLRNSPSGHQLNFYPNARTGDYNSIVQSNDKSLIFHNGTQGQGNFVLAPWSAAGVTSGLRMDANGQIAINTATPFALMTIAQNSAFSSRNIAGRNWGENNNPSQIMLTGATNTNKRLAVGYNTVDDGGAIQALDYTVGLKKLLLNPAGGVVGVNRTDPFYTMDISGDLRATGDLHANGTCFLGPYNTRTQIGADPNAYVIIGRGRTDAGNGSYLDLQVRNGGNFTDSRFIRNTGTNGNLDIVNYGSGLLAFGTNGVAGRMVIDGNGRVGIGVAAPGARLDVYMNGSSQTNAIIRSGTTGTPGYQTDWPSGWGGGLATFDITCASIYYNSLVQRSDARKKKDVVNYNRGLKEVIQLRPVTYKWIDNTFDKDVHAGFIAQEVEQIIPEIVGEDNLGFKSIKTESYVPLLVNAIQELKSENNSLKSELSTMKSEITIIKQKLGL